MSEYSKSTFINFAISYNPRLMDIILSSLNLVIGSTYPLYLWNYPFLTSSFKVLFPHFLPPDFSQKFPKNKFLGIFRIFLECFWENTMSKGNPLYSPKGKIEYSLFPFPPLFFLCYFLDNFLMISKRLVLGCPQNISRIPLLDRILED